MAVVPAPACFLLKIVASVVCYVSLTYYHKEGNLFLTYKFDFIHEVIEPLYPVTED